MLVQINRYRVQPDKMNVYRAIQERAGELYHRYSDSPSVLLRSQDDPCQWTEIRWYSDEAAYHQRMMQLNQEPEMAALWSDLQTTLDPTSPLVVEEYYDQVDLSALMSQN